MPHLTELISKAIAEAGVQVDEVLGIGVGISGIFGSKHGYDDIVAEGPQLEKCASFECRFRRNFQFRLKLEDSRSHGARERRFGGARNESDFLYLMIAPASGPR